VPEHLSAVTKLAFSPDNSRIATRSSQGVALFDVRTGTPLLTLHESNGPYRVREFVVPGKVAARPTTLDFSRDGRRIIEAVVAPDATAGNIRVLIKTWDGSPVTKR
jgi:WD40 repeat protein